MPVIFIYIIRQSIVKGVRMDKKVYLGSCAPKPCEGAVHVIEPGDTLYSIAQRYHTRVRVLLELNPFVDIYNLQPGDEICVPADKPGKKADLVPYVVKRGETLGSFLEYVTGNKSDGTSGNINELLKINRCMYEIPVPEGMIILLPVEKDKRDAAGQLRRDPSSV